MSDQAKIKPAITLETDTDEAVRLISQEMGAELDELTGPIRARVDVIRAVHGDLIATRVVAAIIGLVHWRVPVEALRAVEKDGEIIVGMHIRPEPDA